MARIRPIHHDVGFDAGRPVAENDHAIGEEQRLLGIVSDEQRRKALALPQRDDLGLHRDPRQRVELAKRLVEHEDFGIVDERTGQRESWAMPPES